MNGVRSGKEQIMKLFKKNCRLLPKEVADVIKFHRHKTVFCHLGPNHTTGRLIKRTRVALIISA